MKSFFNKQKQILTVLAAMILTSVSMAQGPGKGVCKAFGDIPNLTNDQKTQIDQLRTSHMKEMTTFRADLDKLQAELRQLEIVDNPDMKKVDAKIDEISAVKNKMAKERANHRLAVRGLLTPEQKVYFDANCCHGPRKGDFQGRGNGQGFKDGKGKCGGPCMGKGPGSPKNMDPVQDTE